MCHDLEKGLEQGMASPFLSNAFIICNLCLHECLSSRINDHG
jgi:hypothetical protein